MNTFVSNLTCAHLVNVLRVSVVFTNYLYDCSVWQEHLNIVP